MLFHVVHVSFEKDIFFQLSAILSDETGIEHVKKEGPTRPKKSSFALMQEVFGRGFCFSFLLWHYFQLLHYIYR